MRRVDVLVCRTPTQVLTRFEHGVSGTFPPGPRLRLLGLAGSSRLQPRRLPRLWPASSLCEWGLSWTKALHFTEAKSSQSCVRCWGLPCPRSAISASPELLTGPPALPHRGALLCVLRHQCRPHKAELCRPPSGHVEWTEADGGPRFRLFPLFPSVPPVSLSGTHSCARIGG